MGRIRKGDLLKQGTSRAGQQGAADDFDGFRKEYSNLPGIKVIRPSKNLNNVTVNALTQRTAMLLYMIEYLAIVFSKI